MRIAQGGVGKTGPALNPFHEFFDVFFDRRVLFGLKYFLQGGHQLDTGLEHQPQVVESSSATSSRDSLGWGPQIHDSAQQTAHTPQFSDK